MRHLIVPKPGNLLNTSEFMSKDTGINLKGLPLVTDGTTKKKKTLFWKFQTYAEGSRSLQKSPGTIYVAFTNYQLMANLISVTASPILFLHH